MHVSIINWRGVKVQFTESIPSRTYLIQRYSQSTLKETKKLRNHVENLFGGLLIFLDKQAKKPLKARTHNSLKQKNIHLDLQ